jgi:hypothetical protein
MISEGLTMLIRVCGYAATKAYMLYAEPTYLEFAKEAWQTANGFTISSPQAQNGSIPGKNFTLAKSCGGGTSGLYLIYPF